MRKNTETKNRQMRRMAKKGVVLSLCTCMTIGLLTGCGKSNSDTTAEAPTYEEPAYVTEDYMTESDCSETFISEASEGVCATESASGASEKNASYQETNDCTMVAEECLPGYYDPYGNVEYGNTESYEKGEDNNFLYAAKEPLSTFSSSVDTASYSNVRRMIEDGYPRSYIPADAVRPEEFVNYFSYDLKKPSMKEKFAVTAEVSTCPWNEDHKLMFVGVATPEIDLREAPASNIVFLIDVSGSMSDPDKLPLLQKSFAKLTDSLSARDRVSIVTYANGVNVVLSGESAKNKGKIIEALDSLYASGGTNGEGGIQMAYKLAEDNFIKNGNNRIILATDGDLNIGVSDPDGLEKLISKKRSTGIYLSVLGFGTGNLKDDNMERLADCGNGNYSYIDSLYEAKKVLVEELGSNLVAIADDVKFQVEFNPQNVNSYRLIGYENHMLANEDFYDESVDAGEIGAGHQVVALYEIATTDSKSSIALKYSDDEENTNSKESSKKGGKYADEFATVKISYKNPGQSEANYLAYTVKKSNITKTPSDNLKFAGMAAEFAMLLSNSRYVDDSGFEAILNSYKTLKHTDEYKDEFYYLVRCMAQRTAEENGTYGEYGYYDGDIELPNGNSFCGY